MYICIVRVISFKTIRAFYENPVYGDAEVSLRSWYQDAKTANWKNPNELKNQYLNASILREGRVVFNIKGNSYRLVVAIDYEFQIIFVRFIGAHKQYDKIDVKSI
ncbi:MAG: type II toxin-antitoxin system HigB family toxin [Cyclobacteriaceae bacterium]|nr:type II toxin-antitoxin system HigB family toxin [Cyclobacteriaceae bacterium]